MNEYNIYVDHIEAQKLSFLLNVSTRTILINLYNYVHLKKQGKNNPKKSPNFFKIYIMSDVDTNGAG